MAAEMQIICNMVNLLTCMDYFLCAEE